MFKLIKTILCKHNYVFKKIVYGDEIHIHNGKRMEYQCTKCKSYIWK